MKTKFLAGAAVLITAVTLMVYPYFHVRTDGVFTTVSTKQVKVTSTSLNYRSGAGTA